MMAAQGIDIDRSTLAGWTGQTAALLDPIVARIREQGLKATKLHTDDTPVPVLDSGRGRTATGRLWVDAVNDRASGTATPPLLWYEFTTDRAAAIYSVIETCKANGVDPQTCIADLTAKIAGNWPALRWDELMPWNWKADAGPQVAQAA